MEWLGTFLVVFRESLEIALTLVLVLAATQSLPRRARWINGGLLAGVLGSIAFAFFTQAITDMMEGMGQELFQASVLTCSAVLIAYTVVWMQRHSFELIQSVKQQSRAIVEGQKPMYALGVLIALTVLRDGAEVALLSQGFFAAGASNTQLIFGGVAGLAAGMAIGALTYWRLVKVNTRLIFQVLAVSLIFVAAGMAAQAIGFLNAAGMTSMLTTPLWDTSHIVSERSMIGMFLHILFGYSSRPTGNQVLVYIATFSVVFALWLRAKRGYARPSTAFSSARVAA